MPSFEEPFLDPEHGRLLLDLARASIRHGLAHGGPLPVAPAELPEALRAPGATFVTLQRDGDLRGCMGRTAATRSLAADVAANAFAAAFRDGRFPPVTGDEVDALAITVSILSPLEPLAFSGEADLAAHLVPRRDGLLIQAGPRRALYLPEVWTLLPDPGDFLRNLKRKAGLPARGGEAGLEAWRFTARCVTEATCSSGSAP